MTRTRSSLVPALGMLLLAPLAACSADEGDQPGAASASSSPSATASATRSAPSASTSPSATPSASTSPGAGGATAPAEQSAEPGQPEQSPTDGGSGVAPAPGGPTPSAGPYGRLLTAQELPGFGADWAWQEFESVPREDSPFTLCQRFLFADIGATEVVVRRFDAAVAGADGDGAGELVATFPDATQARRATSVLQSWAEDCSPENGSVTARVSPWTRVQVADGTGAWYAVTVNPDDPEQSRTERATVVQRGNRVAVVRTELLGKPRDYPATQDPAARSAAPAAAKLTR